MMDGLLYKNIRTYLITDTPDFRQPYLLRKLSQLSSSTWANKKCSSSQAENSPEKP